jgi:phage-related protein
MPKAWFDVVEYPAPYSTFLESIRKDIELLAAVKASVFKLVEQGNELGSPISEPLEDGIFELRPHSSNRHARLLYYFKKGERKAVIVHCFIKKTSKTPREDIELAKQRRRLLEASKAGKRGSNGHRKAH